jgi:diguanylate cyclase (GGDEF)-like protein
MPENKITSVQEQVDTLRVRALSKLTDYLVVSAVFLFAAFLYRLTDTDWQDTYILQFIVFFLLMVTITIRDKLSYKTTIYCYLSLGFILAISEFISLGLSGMGEVASLFCIMLSLFYLDKKSTAVVSLIITVIFGVTFYEYLYAGRTLSENDIAYVSWHSAWIGRFTAHATFFLVLGVSILFLQDQIIRLLLELETQKQTIESQKEQIEHLANHDALTGLPSLRVADDRLEAALDLATQQNHKSALLFLDLDGFKAINDTHGHEAGDEVLKQIAERISSVIRSEDIACRVGGDEFLVIVEKVKSLSDLESLCQRLILVISMPLPYKDIELAVGVSIGAASYPCSASSSRDLRLKADELMYQVKKSGKNNYRILMD